MLSGSKIGGFQLQANMDLQNISISQLLFYKFKMIIVHVNERHVDITL